MANSTWSELAEKMRKDMAAGNWRTKSYDIDGMRKEFFAPEEFLKMLEYVEKRASEEQNPFAGRVSMRSAER